MTEKNTFQSQRRNRKHSESSSQPEPMSGSKKTKQKNHVSSTHGEGS